MRISRRRWLQAGSAALVWPGLGRTQATYPSRPIRMLVQFPPGGNVDTLARLLATRLTTQLGQQVLVENRAGANGAIAYQALAAAAPDGYTLGFGHVAQLAMNPHLIATLGYRPLQDFTAICRLADAPNVLATHPAVKASNLGELLALARAAPGRISLAHAGIGTVGHLSGAWLEKEAGVDFLEVPYKGSAQVASDLMAGQVMASFGALPSYMPGIVAGKLRALAVTTARRLAAYPAIPTVAESGFPGYHAVAWIGLIGPAGLAPAVVAVLAREAQRAIAAPDARESLDRNGYVPVPAGAREFAAFIESEYQAWGKIIRERGYKVE